MKNRGYISDKCNGKYGKTSISICLPDYKYNHWNKYFWNNYKCIKD